MDAETEQLLSIAPLDDALADRRQRRGAHRRLFRDMVKGELEVGPLTWLRRRALVKFAERLDIDRVEAHLLIRGVEYEGAMIPPAAMPSTQATPDNDTATQKSSAAVIRMIVMLLLVGLYYLALRFAGVVPF